MKGRIIDIATALRPNQDGTVEGIITIKSDTNANCFDVLAWKTDPQPTKEAAMKSIISLMETIKKDIELYLAIHQISEGQVQQ